MIRVNKVSKVELVREQSKRVVPTTKTNKNRNSHLSFKEVLELKLGGDSNE
jgi:hypothetical protein